MLAACGWPAGQRKAAGRFSIIGPEGEDEKLATTLHEATERGQHREIVRRAPAAARADARVAAQASRGRTFCVSAGMALLAYRRRAYERADDKYA